LATLIRIIDSLAVAYFLDHSVFCAQFSLQLRWCQGHNATRYFMRRRRHYWSHTAHVYWRCFLRGTLLGVDVARSMLIQFRPQSVGCTPPFFCLTLRPAGRNRNSHAAAVVRRTLSIFDLFTQDQIRTTFEPNRTHCSPWGMQTRWF